jgi:BolA protein
VDLLPLARHRKINAILKAELDGQIHALALHTFTADEWFR